MAEADRIAVMRKGRFVRAVYATTTAREAISPPRDGGRRTSLDNVNPSSLLAAIVVFFALPLFGVSGSCTLLTLHDLAIDNTPVRIAVIGAIIVIVAIPVILRSTSSPAFPEKTKRSRVFRRMALARL